MKCKLCLEAKPLLKKSHIIPDFMYQELFDAKHQFYRSKTPNPDNHSKLPTGEYDQNILCAECDNVRIGQFEDYARKVLYGGKLAVPESPTFINQVNPHGMKYTYCQNINYKKFKLFLLSILWRASISKREFFSSVKLESYEEEILRQMIINEDPKEPDDFPCVMVALRNDEPMALEIIVEPIKTKTKACIICKFLISGVMYAFYVSKHNLPNAIFDGVINKSNKMKIFHVPKGFGRELLIGYLGFNR